jgi:hypothetical protein
MVHLETVEPAPDPSSSWRNKVTELAGRVRGGSSKVDIEDTQTEWNKSVSIVSSSPPLGPAC